MTLLETKSLAKSFGDTHAVNHVNFSVAQGELLALIGSDQRPDPSRLRDDPLPRSRCDRHVRA